MKLSRGNPVQEQGRQLPVKSGRNQEKELTDERAEKGRLLWMLTREKAEEGVPLPALTRRTVTAETMVLLKLPVTGLGMTQMQVGWMQMAMLWAM